MPNAPPKPCNHPGCRAYSIEGGRCEAHKRLKQKHSDQERGSSTERGYGYKWQQASKGFLKSHPLCQCNDCLEGEKQFKQSEVVDHIIPPRLKEANDSGDQARIDKARQLFWNKENWQAMNKQCHDKKTAKENGGFTGYY